MKNLSDLKPIEHFIAAADGVDPINSRPLWKVGDEIEFRPSAKDNNAWWLMVIDGAWCRRRAPARQWVSSDPVEIVGMHRLVESVKLKSMYLTATASGSVDVGGSVSVSWSAGDTIVFVDSDFGSSWSLHRSVQDGWEVAPICPGEEVRVFNYLKSLGSLKSVSEGAGRGSVAGRAACSKPNVQEIDRVGEPQPRDFIATHMGGIANSDICWDKGNEVVFYRDKQSWVVQIRSWTASEGALRASNPFVVAAHRLRPDEIEQVWRALNAAPTLKASGTPLPPKQTSVKELAAYAARDAEMTAKLARENLAVLDFIAPTAGSISTSAEGGLGWDEGERIVFRAFDRLSAYYEDGAWELILGGNTCKISRDRVLDVHRGLVKFRDVAKEPQKEPEPEKEPEPTPDPYRMHRLNDVNNSLTHAQTAVTKTLSALQALRMAVTGEPRRNGKRKSIVKRPTSLATAAKSMRHMLRELQQLTEQMEKRSGK